MARIRTIKPEFWTSPKLSECSVSARLLFIGLWNFCDDGGRHIFDPMRIKMEVYPGDNFSKDAIHGMLTELSVRGLIQVYVVDNKQYLQVTNWLEHQHINRATPSRLPEPSCGTHVRLSESSPLEGNGREREGKEKKDSRTAPSEGRGSAIEERGEEAFREFKAAYPKRHSGANYAWAVAEKKFLAAVRAGESPKNIISGARKYADAEVKRVGTEFIAMPSVWLNQQRWKDYAPEIEPQNNGGWRPGLPTDEELRAKYAKENLRGSSERTTSVVEIGVRPRETQRELVQTETRQRGIQSLGQALSRAGMGAAVFSQSAAASGMHNAVPVARMDEFSDDAEKLP